MNPKLAGQLALGFVLAQRRQHHLNLELGAVPPPLSDRGCSLHNRGFPYLTTGPNFGEHFKTKTVTGTTPNAIEIAAGRVMHILNFTAENNSTGFLTVTVGNVTQRVAVVSNSSTTPPKDLYFSGPATVSFQALNVAEKALLTYRMFDNVSNAAVATPSSTVVVPADVAGPVDIILESSTDLITWTAATPGSYGSSTSKRFFRVRAVAQ